MISRPVARGGAGRAMAPHQLIWPLHQTSEILAESGEVPADVSIEALGLLGKVNKPEFALMTGSLSNY